MHYHGNQNYFECQQCKPEWMSKVMCWQRNTGVKPQIDKIPTAHELTAHIRRHSMAALHHLQYDHWVSLWESSACDDMELGHQGGPSIMHSPADVASRGAPVLHLSIIMHHDRVVTACSVLHVHAELVMYIQMTGVLGQACTVHISYCAGPLIDSTDPSHFKSQFWCSSIACFWTYIYSLPNGLSECINDQTIVCIFGLHILYLL